MRLDLSTCVCRYGPPPSALAALRELPAGVLRRHPYGADDALAEAYAAYLAVDPDELVVGPRGQRADLAARSVGARSRVVVPRPGYTEYQRAFPGAGVGPPGVHHAMEVVAEQLAAGRVVLLSNPHNPSGRCARSAELLTLAGRRPRRGAGRRRVLRGVRPDPAAASVLGAPAGAGLPDNVPENVIVLRSPSKFFGLAGHGWAWPGRPPARLRAMLRGRRGSWPVSALEVAPVVAALADRDWIAATHAALRSDACWLGRPPPPARRGGGRRRWWTAPWPTSTCWRSRTSYRPASAFAAAGLGVRAVGRGHGLAGPALRLAAPRADERAAGRVDAGGRRSAALSG